MECAEGCAEGDRERGPGWGWGGGRASTMVAARRLPWGPCMTARPPWSSPVAAAQHSARQAPKTDCARRKRRPRRPNTSAAACADGRNKFPVWARLDASTAAAREAGAQAPSRGVQGSA